MNEKLKLVGCALDADEREPVIEFKREMAFKGYPGLNFRDPYDAVLHRLGNKIDGFKIDVEPWLLPAPPLEYVDLLTVENMVSFIDSNGCWEYSKVLYEEVRDIDPEALAMVGVDHSLSGGVLKFFSEKYEDVALIVLDSHFDAILPSVRCGIIQYDLETNPNSPFDPRDPYIVWRPESYNADSFLSFLIDEKIVEPGNLIVAGVSDYPPSSAFEIDDSRVKRYLNHYLSFEKKGVKIISKNNLNLKNIWKKTIKELDAKHIYISVDIDVGANSALRGARFVDYQGISEDEIYKNISEIIKAVRSRDMRVLGFDIMETDVFRAANDRTYEIERSIFEMLAKIVI